MADFLVVFHYKKEGIETANNIILKAEQYFQKFHPELPDPKSLAAPNLKILQWPRVDGTGICCSKSGKGDMVVSSGTWMIDDGERKINSSSESAENKLSSHVNGRNIYEKDQIDGVYGLVYYDQAAKKLFLRTNKAGNLHIFLREIDKQTVVLSTSQLLLAYLDNLPLCPDAVREFVCTGTIFEDRSLFQKIKKTKPASVYEWDSSGRKQVTSYWDPLNFKTKIRDVDKAADLVAGSLGSQIKKIEELNLNPVADLTGGIDSRMVLLSALKEKAQFSYVTNSVSGSINVPDIVIASKIAQDFNLRYSRQLIPPEWNNSLKGEYYRKGLILSDGLYNSFKYATTLYFQELCRNRGNNMTLNGRGGELLRDFWWEPAWPFPEIRRGYRLEGLVKRYSGTRFLDMKMFENNFNLYDHFRGVFDRTTGNANICAGEKLNLIYLYQRMQRWQGSIASATNRVWNQASPLLGNEFLDAVFSIHPSLIKNMKVTRHLFTKYNKKLALIKTDSSAPLCRLSFKDIGSYKAYCGEILNSYINKISSRMNKKDDSFSLGAETTPGSSKIRLDKCAPLIEGIFNIDYLRMIFEPDREAEYPYREQIKNIIYLMDILGLIGG